MKLDQNTINRLVEILAMTDALFTPFRWNEFANAPTIATAVSERLGDYPKRGVPYVVSGDVTERAAGERHLQSMDAAGLIHLRRAATREGVALTDHGDDIARSLTAGYTAHEAFPLLKRVRMVERRIGDTNAGVTNECDVLGKSDYDKCQSRDLVALENKALPLLRRGWLTSAGDREGRIGYEVTESGFAARRPKLPADLPAFEQEAYEKYFELFKSALAGRKAWKPAMPSHVHVPLSCGMWP